MVYGIWSASRHRNTEGLQSTTFVQLTPTTRVNKINIIQLLKVLNLKMSYLPHIKKKNSVKKKSLKPHSVNCDPV